MVLTVWVAACCCLPNLVLSQGALSKKVLLSIQPGESIVTSESCIDVGYSADQLFVVTRSRFGFVENNSGAAARRTPVRLCRNCL